MKAISLFISITLLASFACRAQNFDITIGAALTNQQGSVLVSSYPGSSQSFITTKMEVDEKVKVPEVGVSYYQPLFPQEGKFSLGAMVGFNLMLSYKKVDYVNQFGNSMGSKTSPLYASYAVPVLAMFKGGCGAFKDNDEGFGGAIGGGISMIGFTMPYEKGFMVSPDFCAEIRWNRIGLRAEYMTKKFVSEYQTDNKPIPRVTTSFMYISLLIGLY
ncbi:hypothetical protein BH11BAC7_BH11BAC7_24940 [soil metagenome]